MVITNEHKKKINMLKHNTKLKIFFFNINKKKIW